MDPGDEAVEVAGKLQVKLISAEVGVDADMIARWSTARRPPQSSRRVNKVDIEESLPKLWPLFLSRACKTSVT